jgi:hypothetical protein
MYRNIVKSESERELDIIRNRIHDVEEKVSVTTAWKRIAYCLLAITVVSVTLHALSFSHALTESKKEPCKDTILQQNSTSSISCPHSNQTLVGYNCFCKR